MFWTFVIFCFLGGVVFAFWKTTSDKKTQTQLPPGISKLPGPKGLPVIGSVHELEPNNPWMSFHKWGLQYGPIYQVNLAGHNHVWIQDEDIAHDLLAVRAGMYSDRPHIPGLIHDNRDSGEYLPLMSRNKLWSRQRRFAKSIMDESQKFVFHGYPELEAKRLMKELLDDPKRYNTHLESFISRVTCRLAWGTSEASDELKQRARELLIGVSPTGALGNKLPFLMSLPDWIVPAKAWERRRMATEKEFFEIMQRGVQSDLDKGSATSSWMKAYLSQKEKWNFRNDLEGAFAVGMHGIAGALTIAAPMQGFCLAMCHHGNFLPKLQAEIDAVCGARPPCYADMPRMPYLRACIRETLRWRPPVPTGIPHLLVQDDVYAGYHIPAGSVMHPLEWSMSRNAAKYPAPESYNPERWLDPAFPTFNPDTARHPTICEYSQFGYGRRICQGQGVAEADLFVGIGAVAWAFDIRKARSPETGLEIQIPEMEYSELLIAKPKWFQFSLTPRSEEKRLLIQELWKEENDKGSFKPSKVYWDPRNPKLGWGKV